ncbi:MAG: tryptophan-rich sensory protein [Cyclobacteriaceae bacterium]
MLNKILNLIGLVAVIYVNYLANALPINGKTTGALSDQYANLFVPAGLTFAIWGLIYLLLIVFVIIQFLPQFQSSVTTNYLFVLTCAFNISWIIAWHYEKMALSLVIMLGLLVTLTVMNLSLSQEKQQLHRLIFGVYLGWILIATVANATAGLVSMQWNGFGISQVTWTLMLIGVGALIAGFAMFRLNNPYLAISVAWAFLGIVIKRTADQPNIVLGAKVGMVLVLVACIFVIIRMVRLKSA